MESLLGKSEDRRIAADNERRRLGESLVACRQELEEAQRSCKGFKCVDVTFRADFVLVASASQAFSCRLWSAGTKPRPSRGRPTNGSRWPSGFRELRKSKMG